MVMEQGALRPEELHLRVEGEALGGSAVGLQITWTALDRSVAVITAECRAIGETLGALDDALGAIAHGDDRGSWGDFGVVGLPILGALRVARGVAGQYVRQETGTSLNEWVDFVGSSTRVFDDYLELLAVVAEASGEHHGDDGSPVSADELELLLDARWRTRAWKLVLERVARLGRVVEAILEVDLDRIEPVQAAEEGSSGLSGALQRRFKDAQARVLDTSVDMREWVFRPFIEVRDRVTALPGQVEAVTDEVTLLEILLDLAIAQLCARRGDIGEAEARAVGMRVAAAVVLPELALELSGARLRLAELERSIERLNTARTGGRITERVHAILADEYERDLAACRSQAAELEARAQAWRRDGPSIIDRCTEWAQLELDVLAARSITEEHDPPDDRRLLLQRELQRLHEVRSTLEVL